ncbi:MAG TPA: SRPBCC family protein [Streptosporangiaceae bacterium]|nr:SRPBCC family protein [Streptosporangiaceae bacterium]
MEMDHSFTVPVPPDRAWDVLLDVEKIAPCMPGATVDEFDGEVVTGRIKVKVGPVSLTYRGTAKFTERDPDARVILLEASGKETRGAGTASATVRATLEPESGGEGTTASMHTTMNVTGRPAQFGRGVMVEVGSKLVEQFAQNLRQLIAEDGAAGGNAVEAEAEAEAGAGAAGTSQDGPGSTQPSPVVPAAATTATPTAPTPTAQPPAASADSINLVKLVGPSLLKRVIPVAVAAAGLALLGRWLFRRGAKG